MTIAKAIREYRLIQGMTQRELSQKIHKSERMIKRYENGKIIPSIQILGKIFNKSIDEMISLE
ncbi:helix-turn-helix transcriptional regulator [Clostridium butyricum]|uniref:HTH cro/C1-type domain-containing protein n=1 Tax=Clostridium butyricum TaxID=1492 RepID=A0A2S7FD02_CLOBU|nr:helix-turn-helix transcriptional regulator [Clostridium butyricum]KHD13422.1 hypothetical protein OA81_20920 [Clostridium butyricum]PPV16547.1 hypothetical protein AWN73_09770 [Clostridium butyricum]